MAGRIPDSFVQDLLARTDIVEVIGSRLDLKRAGKEFKALSPFTHEKSPSFYVNPAKQMFFDFSSGRNGTAISFLMEYDRLSFVDAVEELAKRAGVVVPREGGGGESLVLEGPLDALAAAERFYRTQLRTHQPAVEYLKKRGVSGETAKLFGIGYAPESWDALARLFPDPEHALSAGLLIPRDGGGVYDRFRNRVMFPIRDLRGRVIGFGGRTLGNDPAKYLNSPEKKDLFHKGRNLFGLYEAKQSSKGELPYLMVVEGYMDTVMLAQHGIRNVVATLGTATTRDHVERLFKSTARVVFCFDGDRAGRAAAWRALEQALPETHEGRECRFMFLPEGHDPDTLVQEIGADAFRSRVDSALPLSEFLLSELSKRVDLATRDGRASLVSLAKPHLDQIRNPSLHKLLLGELARRTGIASGDIASVVASLKSKHLAQSQGNSGSQGVDRSGAHPVKRALQLLLEKPALARQVENMEQIASARFSGVAFLVEVIEFFQENENLDGAALLEVWRDTPKADAIRRVMGSDLNRSDIVEKSVADRAGEQGIEKEFLDAISFFRQRSLRERLQELVEKARSSDLSPSEAAEINQISRQLSDARLV